MSSVILRLYKPALSRIVPSVWELVILFVLRGAIQSRGSFAHETVESVPALVLLLSIHIALYIKRIQITFC